MKMANAIAALGAAALVCGCGGRTSNPTTAKQFTPPDSFKQVDGKSLLPLAVGNEWTYKLVDEVTAGSRQGSRTEDVTFRIVDVTKDSQGGTRATMNVTIGGKLADQIVWNVNDKGIFQLSARVNPPSPYSPPQPEVVFPVQPFADPKQTFRWQGSGPMPIGGPGTADFMNTVVGPELVDTAQPIGNAKDVRQWAIVVKTSGKMTVMVKDSQKAVAKPHDGATIVYQYWIPNVGIGRVVTESTISGVIAEKQTLSLRHYQVKEK